MVIKQYRLICDTCNKHIDTITCNRIDKSILKQMKYITYRTKVFCSNKCKNIYRLNQTKDERTKTKC